MNRDATAAAGLATFESHRPMLVAHAYRMLGDMGRAEDMVQEAWLRWDGRHVEVASPRAYLVTMVTRLCFSELNSAKMRHEESRSGRLPEPVDLDLGGIGRVEALERVSMAFLVVLHRLSPAERAVLLLREVFDFEYKEIADLVGKSEAACRKLLQRARESVRAEKKLFATSAETHQRVLDAFLKAAQSGDVNALVELLSQDAILIADAGPEGRRVGGIRSLPAPLHGATQVAAFIVAAARRARFEPELHQLNGQPALVVYDDQDQPFAALLLGVADERVHRIFFHADLARLGHVGPRKT